MFDHNSYKTPSYYVRKRLFKNKPAMFGLIIIVISHIIAGLGYLIMPDHTPNANNSAPQIQKKPPFYAATIMKLRKNVDVPQVNWLQKIYNGQESEYTIIPITTYRIEGDKIYYLIDDGRKDSFRKHDDKEAHRLRHKEKSCSLVDAVKPIYVGSSPKFTEKSQLENYVIHGDTVTYLDINEKIRRITLVDLAAEFKENNIDQRTYYLGTDRFGRDILSRLLFGTRISLSIGFIALLISLVVGVSLGAIAGFFGGTIDAVILWLMTVVWSIPSIMLVIAISLALHSKGIWVAFVAVGLTMWVEIARVVRGEIMSIKQKLYVEAARAFGLTSWRIIYVHILPNMLGSLIVIATSNFASAILVEAGLSFLGLGVQAPMPSWGMMVYEGFQAIGTKDSWHLIMLPSLCISLLVLAFNLLGNGLRDAYDPKTLS